MSSGASVCSVGQCGRRAFAKGLCKSHWRHQKEGKPLGEIRTWGKGLLEKFEGLYLRKSTVEAIQDEARKSGASSHKVIGSVLDQWAARRRPK